MFDIVKMFIDEFWSYLPVICLFALVFDFIGSLIFRRR